MKKLITLGSLLLGSCLLLSSCSFVSVSRIAKCDELETTNPYFINLKDEFNSNYNLFAADISDIANEGNENTCVSPISIYSALAMLAFSTNSNTKHEILTYMNTTEDDLRDNYKELFQASNYYDNQLGDYRESLCNSIWVQNDFDYKKDGVKFVSEYSCADIYKIDFTNNNANKYITDYVKDKTHDLIDQDFGLDASTQLALINTLYLNDVWNEKGDDISITDKKIKFKNADNTTTEDNFLIKSRSGKAYSNEEIRAMTVSTFNNYNITFIVPKDNYKIKDVFNSKNINEAINADYYDYDTTQYSYTTINKFPMFNAKSNLDIVNNLKAKGIKDVFDASKADFSPISNIDLFCSKVIHSTNLSVDRKGIIGAAATVATMKATAAAPSEVIRITEEFIVDRAFGYLIGDSRNRILFSGIINKI